MAGDCIALQDGRSRLKDSNVSATELRQFFVNWFTLVGSRLIDQSLAVVSSEWPHRGMPSPAQLVQMQPRTLVEGILKIDDTLHPRHSRLVIAILAEHGVKPCFEGTRGIELECMLLSRLVLGVLRKYRDLAKYNAKWIAVCKKASPDERAVLSRIVEAINIPCDERERPAALMAAPIHDLDLGSMSTAIVPWVAGDALVEEFDELDNLSLELGLLFGPVTMWGYFLVAPPSSKSKPNSKHCKSNFASFLREKWKTIVKPIKISSG